MVFLFWKANWLRIFLTRFYQHRFSHLWIIFIICLEFYFLLKILVDRNFMFISIFKFITTCYLDKKCFKKPEMFFNWSTKYCLLHYSISILIRASRCVTMVTRDWRQRFHYYINTYILRYVQLIKIYLDVHSKLY